MSAASHPITKDHSPRHPAGMAFKFFCQLSAFLTIFSLASIVIYILVNGVPHLTPGLFAVEYNSNNVSMFHAIFNTLIMTAMALLVAVPVGVFGGIYLAEYAKSDSPLVRLVRVTAETLAGLPSIIYALFGMLFFVTTCGFGYSILSGALTLAIMTLPVILRQTEESLLSVPRSYREGSLALGAGKLRTTVRIVLPVAMPGILAAVLLSIGRIVGETAALVYTAGTVAKIALNPMDSGRTLAVHLFQLQQEGMHLNEAFAVAVVLLIVVLLMNGFSRRLAKSLTPKG